MLYFLCMTSVYLLVQVLSRRKDKNLPDVSKCQEHDLSPHRKRLAILLASILDRLPGAFRDYPGQVDHADGNKNICRSFCKRYM